MTPKTWSVPLTITEKDIESTMIIALEGGSNYWLEFDEDQNEGLFGHGGQSFSEKVARGLMAGMTAKVYDAEDASTKWELTLEKVLKGIELYFNRKGHNVDPTGFENHDVTDADVILQLGLFGEIVYG